MRVWAAIISGGTSMATVNISTKTPRCLVPINYAAKKVNPKKIKLIKLNDSTKEMWKQFNWKRRMMAGNGGGGCALLQFCFCLFFLGLHWITNNKNAQKHNNRQKMGIQFQGYCHCHRGWSQVVVGLCCPGSWILVGVFFFGFLPWPTIDTLMLPSLGNTIRVPNVSTLGLEKTTMTAKWSPQLENVQLKSAVLEI